MKRNKPTLNVAGPSRRSANFEFRMEHDEETGVRTINGHGSVFNSLSKDLGGFREIIHPGAFTEALRNSDVVCLFNHDANLPLGKQSAGNLKVEETDKGLRYECTPTDTSYYRDLQVNIDARVITQSSFAFTMDWESEDTKESGGAYEWEYSEERGWVLNIYRVQELFDVSPVTNPAYEAADVRSAQSFLQRAIERRDQAAKEAKIQQDRKIKADQDYVEIMLAFKDEQRA